MLTVLAFPSSLWSAFPDKSLLAVAGRLDAAAWNDLLSGLLPEDKRQAIRDAANRFAGPALGKNVAKDVLPGLGPDWGLCVLAPAVEMGNPKSWVPHAILALRIQRADVAHAVLKTLNSLALLGVFAYNGSHPDQITFHSLERIEGSYLANNEQFPPGFQPAFALKDGFLVLAQLLPGAAPISRAVSTLPRNGATKFGGVPDERYAYTTQIDGGDVDDAIWGHPTINLSQDAVAEFKVFRNQFDAQYGSPLELGSRSCARYFDPATYSR